MHLLERPNCFKVVEGASILRWYIFLKLHKVLLSLLTPRYFLLAHLFVLRCMLADTLCSVFVSRSLRADWIFNWLLAVCYFPLIAVYRLLLPQFSLLLFVTRYMLLAFRWPQFAICFVSNCSCFLLSTCSSSRQSLSLPSDFRCSTFAASAIALRCSLFAVESSLLPSLMWIKGA